MADEVIKEFVEEWLAKVQGPAQGLETELEEARVKIKKLEENQALLLIESKKVQELKDVTKNQAETIEKYEKAMNMMAVEIKTMQEGNVSKLMDGKVKAINEKLNNVEKANEELVEKLRVETTEKEKAENAVNNVMSVMKTITKANEARNKERKSLRKCREFNKPQGCSWGSKCRFSHKQDEDMVNKSDCSFWLEGQCRFSDQVCRNTHDPTKKGSKSMVNNQSVFRIAQAQSPPPGLASKETPTQGLDVEEGWQTVKNKRKTRKAARRLEGQLVPAPLLEEQTTPRASVVTTSTPTFPLAGESSQVDGSMNPNCPLDGVSNQNPQQILLQVVQTLLQQAGMSQ